MKYIVLSSLMFIITVHATDRLITDFSTGSVQFTANIYKEILKSNSRNYVLCPLSIDTVLALIHSGAKGNTAKQLSVGLHLPESEKEVQEIFKKLTPSLKVNDIYTLTTANKIYVKRNFNISDQFRTIATDIFGSDIQNIDFQKSKEAATDINKWVEENTHQYIKDLVKPSYLDVDTRAVLINAMYFCGKWMWKFPDYNTRKRTFHLDNINEINVDMMEVNDEFNYYACSELKAKFLEMSYKGNELSMTIVLPDDKEGLSTLETRIEDVLIAPNYTLEKVNVKIPKFKSETTIEFNPILKALGIIDAFEDQADFSGIGTNNEPLKISQVIQKVFIEIDEKGTTAAAATAVVVPVKSADIEFYPPFYSFEANRPFLYYIRHKKLNINLFVGRVINPSLD